MPGSSIPWMDNIYIEDKYGWFISARGNMLFRMDMETKTYELITILPKADLNVFRLNPRCIRYRNSVVCLPDFGNTIWIYSLDDDEFMDIILDNLCGERVGATNYILKENSLFLLFNDLKKIFELNIDKRLLVNEYDFSKECGEVFGSTIYGDIIYILDGNLNRILEFDIRTCKIEVFELPNIDDTLNTLCFDGINFWLSGFKRKIYIWHRGDKKVRVLENFFYENENLKIGEDENEENIPKINGHKIPMFRESKIVNNNIFFIPSITCKFLNYNLKTNKIQWISIKDEMEGVDSIKQRDLWTKYLVEYIREDRYIGLYSFKNRCIIEIDSERKEVSRCEYKSTKLSEKLLERINFMGNICLEESNGFHACIFAELFCKENERCINAERKNVGKLIYNASL